MDVLIVFIVALGLAMDCFALAISNSSVSGLVKPGVSLQASLLFAVMHLAMLLGGMWFGGVLQPRFEGMEPWGAFVILGYIGGKMIYGAQRRHPEARVFDINSGRVMFALALAASIDALLVGFALGLLHTSMWLAALLVTLSVFLFSFAGLAGGQNFGLPFAKRTAIFGGVFMLIAALHFIVRLFI
jgi:manganese efflux pump family protein